MQKKKKKCKQNERIQSVFEAEEEFRQMGNRSVRLVIAFPQSKGHMGGMQISLSIHEPESKRISADVSRLTH
jgi:hypothetical protein